MKNTTPFVSIFSILTTLFYRTKRKKNHGLIFFIDSSRGDLLTKYIISLGQPVYIKSFFTGCRFPFSNNQIADNIAYNRYQAGKNFSQLKIEDGFYRCWKTVIGSSRSTSIEAIRNDFYSYITDISVENNSQVALTNKPTLHEVFHRTLVFDLVHVVVTTSMDLLTTLLRTQDLAFSMPSVTLTLHQPNTQRN